LDRVSGGGGEDPAAVPTPEENSRKHMVPLFWLPDECARVLLRGDLQQASPSNHHVVRTVEFLTAVDRTSGRNGLRHWTIGTFWPD